MPVCLQIARRPDKDRLPGRTSFGSPDGTGKSGRVERGNTRRGGAQRRALGSASLDPAAISQHHPLHDRPTVPLQSPRHRRRIGARVARRQQTAARLSVEKGLLAGKAVFPASVGDNSGDNSGRHRAASLGAQSGGWRHCQSERAARCRRLGRYEDASSALGVARQSNDHARAKPLLRYRLRLRVPIACDLVRRSRGQSVGTIGSLKPTGLQQFSLCQRGALRALVGLLVAREDRAAACPGGRAVPLPCDHPDRGAFLQSNVYSVSRSTRLAISARFK